MVAVKKNVGPDGHGQIVKPQMDRLLEAGRWLKKNGAAIYDTVCPLTLFIRLVPSDSSMPVPLYQPTRAHR